MYRFSLIEDRPVNFSRSIFIIYTNKKAEDGAPQLFLVVL